MSFTDLQAGVGAGLRFNTPVGVIRLDLGAPANPRAFDPGVEGVLWARARLLSAYRRRYRPRTVFMIDWTAGLSGAFGASLRKFSK